MKEWTPEEIKEFRKGQGLYQKDLAKMLRVTIQYVCNLEKGVRRPSNSMKALLDCLEKEKGGMKHGKGKGHL